MLTQPPHPLHLTGRRPFDTNAEDIRSAVRWAAGNARPAGVVLHLQGGTGHAATDDETAVRFAAAYATAGAGPLCMIWDTTPISALTENLARAAAEPFFRAVTKVVLKFAHAKTVAGAIGGGAFLPVDDGAVETELRCLSRDLEPFERLHLGFEPDATLRSLEARQFVTALLSSPDVARSAHDIVAAIANGQSNPWGAVRHQAADQLSPELVADLRRDAGRTDVGTAVLPKRMVAGAVAVLARVVRRLASGREHGLYPTVAEEVLREFYVGAAVRRLWNTIETDAAASGGLPGNDGAAWVVFDELTRLWRDGRNPRVTVVGHRTGSVLACHWLARAAAVLPDAASVDVVWLAPTCTMALMADTIRRVGGQIRGFRQFGMSDPLECRDAALPGAYPRSCLYLVSGALAAEADTPILGMERFSGSGNNGRTAVGPDAAAVQAFCAERPDALVWSPADRGPGLASAFVAHEKIGRDPVTLASLQHLLRVGFGPGASR